MSERVPREELQATIEARKELGAELEPELVDSFVERIERRLSETSTQSERALQKRRDRSGAISVELWRPEIPCADQKPFERPSGADLARTTREAPSPGPL